MDVIGYPYRISLLITLFILALVSTVGGLVYFAWLASGTDGSGYLVFSLAVLLSFVGLMDAILVARSSTIGCVLAQALFVCLIVGAVIGIYQNGVSWVTSAVILSASIGFVFSWILRGEFQRSFFRPERRWYQGRPGFISGLRCDLAGEGDFSGEFRVNRIDENGAFLYRRKGQGSVERQNFLEVFSQKSQIDIILSFRDRSFSGRVVPIVSESSLQGLGVCFKGLTPDHRKQLLDLLEALKGEGHVQT